MAYKVLRLLEYTYDTVEDADEDMQRWYVPPVGAKKFNPNNRGIRSTVIQYPFKEETDGEQDASNEATSCRLKPSGC